MQRRPADLNPPGQRAWKRALEHLQTRDADPAALFDQVVLYARAVDRSSRANEQWRKAGRPLIADNPNGSAGVHPLVKAIEDADRAVWRYGRALGLVVPGVARRVGRPTLVDQRRERKPTARDREDPRLRLLEERHS